MISSLAGLSRSATYLKRPAYYYSYLRLWARSCLNYSRDGLMINDPFPPVIASANLFWTNLVTADPEHRHKGLKGSQPLKRSTNYDIVCLG